MTTLKTGTEGVQPSAPLTIKAAQDGCLTLLVQSWWNPETAPNGSTPNVHAQTHTEVGYSINFNSCIPEYMYVLIYEYIHISLYFPMGSTLNTKKRCKYII